MGEKILTCRHGEAWCTDDNPCALCETGVVRLLRAENKKLREALVEARFLINLVSMQGPYGTAWNSLFAWPDSLPPDIRAAVEKEGEPPLE